MQRLFMVNSALQIPTAFKMSPLVPEHGFWAICCVTVYGHIHPGGTCQETTGQCWEHGYSETTDNVNIWPGLGEHQVLAGGYHPLSDFYYWQRNVSDLRESIKNASLGLTGLNCDQKDGCLGIFNETWSEGMVKKSLDWDWRSQLFLVQGCTYITSSTLNHQGVA